MELKQKEEALSIKKTASNRRFNRKKSLKNKESFCATQTKKEAELKLKSVQVKSKTSIA